MIECVLSGKIIKDAEPKVAASGKEYLLLIVRHDEALVRVSLFGDDAQALLGLKRGDSCAVVGSLTIGEWQGKPSLSMMAHRAISPTMRKPPRPKTDKQDSQSQYRAAAHAQRSDGDLPSDLPW